MSEFWLISAPGDKENLQALERMNTVTSKSNLSNNTKFAIPDFKVGTLDSLVGLSDELGKLDTFAERQYVHMHQRTEQHETVYEEKSPHVRLPPQGKLLL